MLNKLVKTFDPTQTFRTDTLVNPNNTTDTVFKKVVVLDGQAKTRYAGGFYRPASI